MTTARRRRVFWILVALYFTQGLPFGFFIQALPVVLRTRGYSLEVVGLTALLALPWALKFLWAPLIDRRGTRRGWILALQAIMTVFLLGLAALGAAEPPLPLLMAGVFGTNLIAATQDIATDGLAVQLLPPEDRGLANGLQVAAYRLGMITGGGALLAAFDVLAWTGAFVMMASCVALSALPILRWREAAPAEPRHASARPSVLGFLRRPRAGRLLVGLLVFKAGEAAATAMLRPMLVDRGYSLSDLGWLLGTVGFSAGLIGALAGGWAVGRGPRRRVLTAFAALQALAVASYAGLAVAPDLEVGMVAAVLGVEHFAGGLATAALFTVMMDRCAAASASTDYTVQASAVVIATGAASTLAGFSAGGLGYPAHFFACALLACAAVLVVPWLVPSKGPRPMTRAVYAGSFDPVTTGHLAVVEAARRVFDEVVVLIADNPAKTTLFPREARIRHLRAALAGQPGVAVDATDGLVVAYARDHGITALVRGLRAGPEAPYELDLARANRTLAPELCTVILPAPPELEAVSSSLLKQMARAGLDGARLCPPAVWQDLQAKLAPSRSPS